VPGGGFEAPAVGGGGYRYAPAGTPWAFSPTAGVSGNGSGFTVANPAAPEGGQVAFLQDGGSVTQAVTLAAGSYSLAFLAAQRGNYQPGGPQTVEVLIDGAVVARVTPASTAYAAYTTAAFAVPAGPHTVTLRGTAAGDATAFLDDIRLIIVL
jgi:hypothetical protein